MTIISRADLEATREERKGSSLQRLKMIQVDSRFDSLKTAFRNMNDNKNSQKSLCKDLNLKRFNYRAAVKEKMKR